MIIIAAERGRGGTEENCALLHMQRRLAGYAHVWQHMAPHPAQQLWRRPLLLQEVSPCTRLRQQSQHQQHAHCAAKQPLPVKRQPLRLNSRAAFACVFQARMPDIPKNIPSTADCMPGLGIGGAEVACAGKKAHGHLRDALMKRMTQPFVWGKVCKAGLHCEPCEVAIDQ